MCALKNDDNAVPPPGLSPPRHPTTNTQVSNMSKSSGKKARSAPRVKPHSHAGISAPPSAHSAQYTTNNNNNNNNINNDDQWRASRNRQTIYRTEYDLK